VISQQGLGDKHLSQNHSLGLWVPAFAGTTSSLRAKRSNPWRRVKKDGLLRRYAPRNDEYAFAFSRHEMPEFCLNVAPPGKQRAQGKPGADCTRGPRATESTGVGPQVNRKHSGFPCANGFNGFLRTLPGDRAFLPPSPLRSFLLRNLTPASGRQDHTTSPSASATLVSRSLRVHRIPPRVRDDRETPLARAGRASL
jgi:hypothetical protein